jgi:hypothetical protein
VTNPVAKTSAGYDAMSKAWALPRALMGGTRAMRDAGIKYLPKEPGESREAYDIRLSRSTLFNAFKRTVGGMTGKVFSRDPVIKDDVPQSIKDWSEDIDLMGRNLATFARDVFADGAQVGISHILVDMPAGEAGKTVAEERLAGRRPYFVHIKAEDLIGWKTETINGKETLSMIRFKEHVTIDDGEYGEKREERIRVIWRDRFETWMENEKKGTEDEEWVLVDSGPMSLGEIALATFYAARTGFMMAEPPLEDLADMNVAHWQSSSDQRHILHVARVPILFGKVLNLTDDKGDKIEIGPNRMITSSDPQGDLKYVEHTGAGITAGRDDLKDIEDRMRVMGLEVYMPRSTGDSTATGKAIDTAEQNSVVKAMALSLQDALEQALMFMAKWAKLGDNGGSVAVNVDYVSFSGQQAQEITALMNAWMSGGISRETFWSEMVRRGFLSDDFDPVTEAERIATEGGGLGATGAAA